jgi:hypothetical protein
MQRAGGAEFSGVMAVSRSFSVSGIQADIVRACLPVFKPIALQTPRLRRLFRGWVSSVSSSDFRRY